jgi:2-hydroxy-3-keto-5-methylthiopentenyl-1-phosphate phosphatase
MIDWHIVCDFDGTITRTDVIDSILQRFADPSWETIEEEWLAGDIGSRECLSRQLALVKATPTELLGFFDGIDIDPDFPDFVDHVIGLGASLEVVSDGIEQGIARILARNYVSLLPILANRLRQVDHDSWRIDFPYASDACRAAAGNCKCKSTPKAKRVLVTASPTCAWPPPPISCSPRIAWPSTASATALPLRASTASPNCRPCWPFYPTPTPPTPPLSTQKHRNFSTMSDIRIATAEDQILLEKEAKYCSYGDTVHYIEPPRIFSRCEGSYVWDTVTRLISTCKCGTRRSTSVTPTRA